MAARRARRSRPLGRVVAVFAPERLLYAGTWPGPVPDGPFDFDARFTIDMIRSGHVRWKWDGAPPKRGWLMSAEESAR
jgi:hypothetical protein